MRYIFMNNYKGFQNEIFPISRVNFLVGENSTGKTSVLKLIDLLSSSSFLFDPEMALRKDENFLDINSVISSASEDKTFFEIGEIYTFPGKEKPNAYIYKFINLKGTPMLKTAFLYENEQLKIMEYIREKTNKAITISIFDIAAEEKDAKCERQYISSLVEKIKNTPDSINAISSITEGLFSHIPFLFLRTSSLESNILKMESADRFSFSVSSEKIPSNFHFPTCKIAPIRTKPKRIYDGLSREFSAEGEHTAFRIHSILNNAVASKRKLFLGKLNQFGKESGLFNEITTQSFGSKDDMLSPFELMVALNKIPLNISDVGYGVSQVLPLLVEFLVNEEREFVVQQPEVHLHPKAQAALGGLIYECAKNQKKLSFMLETHSDYLIDRYRLYMHQSFKKNKRTKNPESQILFFSKSNGFNSINVIKLSNRGALPDELPAEYREFFLNESLGLLEI